jgi:putative phosphotransacetylase
MDARFIKSVVEEVVKNYMEHKETIPVGVSNRHVHVSRGDLDILFGEGYSLKKFKDLSQPGQYAAEDMVTLVGPSGVKTKVRILGPERSKTQVEISMTDGFELGLKPPPRDSGDLAGTPGISIVGPKGSITLKEGVICAWRHIHMTPEDAKKFGFSDKQHVKVKTSGDRGLIFDRVLIRVSSQYRLDMHIDTDEANAGFIKNGDLVEILE